MRLFALLACLLLASCGPAAEPATQDGAAPREEPAATSPNAPPPAEAPAFPPVERPADAAEILRVGGDVQKPRVISKDTSFLDASLGRESWSSCIAEIVISRDGRVEQARLLEPENPAPKEAQLILEMFERWRFEPATLDGQPVAVYYHLVIDHCPVREHR